MGLSETQIKIIADHPLDEAWVKARDSAQAQESTVSNLSNLLGLLILSPAAFNLVLPDGSGNVASRLLKMRQSIGDVEPQRLQTFIRSVSASRADVDVWAAVIDLIEAVELLAAPSATILTFPGTPVKSSSSRLSDSETRDIVQAELFEEIRNCTFRTVGGFWDRFFNPQGWSREQKAMLKGVAAAHDGRKWTGFPSIPDEQPVWDWLRSLEDRFLTNAPYKLYTTRTATQFKERKGQMDLFFQIPAARANGGAFEYKHVLVVGEQKKSNDTGKFKATLLQIARYVRGIFSDQPTRRFVHAFSLCSSTMELWVFDRSGPYSSGPFNIHDEPEKFARALVGYATADDDAMGLDTFIERKSGHRHVMLYDKNGSESIVRLTKPIVRQRAIVCRGTTCYATRNGHVAKFSWTSGKRRPEVDMLKLAEERNVQGVARVVAYRRIDSIADIRGGLEFPQSHRFRDDAVHFEDLPAAAASSSTSSRKRSSDDSSDNTSGPSKRRSSRQKSKLSQEFNEQQATNKTRPSLYTTGQDPWEDRIFSCLVVSPAGRVIGDFVTVRELLESMRDAIKAHQSLYTIGDILHRDISSNNILITEPKLADGFKGILIDLDLAKLRGSGPSGARHRTGTMQFMAIEVLRKADHTYRHDLESFFYVLLWMCARVSWAKEAIRGGGKTAPRESLLRNWEIGSFKDIAIAKMGLMTVDGLDMIMDEFPETLVTIKPLFIRLRKVLFSFEGGMNFGTPPGDPDQLYRPIIAAYDETIGNLEG